MAPWAVSSCPYQPQLLCPVLPGKLAPAGQPETAPARGLLPDSAHPRGWVTAGASVPFPASIALFLLSQGLLWEGDGRADEQRDCICLISFGKQRQAS